MADSSTVPRFADRMVWAVRKAPTLFDLNAREAALLANVVMYAGDRNRCTQSIEVLAGQGNCGVTTTREHLHNLEAKGAIQGFGRRRGGRRKGRGRGLTVAYRICYNPAVDRRVDDGSINPPVDRHQPSGRPSSTLRSTGDKTEKKQKGNPRAHETTGVHGASAPAHPTGERAGAPMSGEVAEAARSALANPNRKHHAPGRDPDAPNMDDYGGDTPEFRKASAAYYAAANRKD